MATEAPRPYYSFHSPPPRHHLAELRIEPAPSAVAFSAPCAAGKRRCLLPPSSPRKKVLLELHPFGSLPSPSRLSPSPTPSPQRSPATAPPSLSSRAAGSSSRSSDFSFPSGIALTAGGNGGGGGGNMFAFFEDAVTTPTGSSGSALSLLASPGRPATPTGSPESGGFAFVASPKQPTTPRGSTAGEDFSVLAPPKLPTATAGPTANGGFVFLASPEKPLMPTRSNTGGGCASLSYEPSLSPNECQGKGAVASLPSPTPASSSSIESGGFAFFPSPGSALGNTCPPGFAASKQLVPPGSTGASPSFVFSAWPVHKSDGGSRKRPRDHLRLAIPRRKNLRLREEQQPVTSPPQKVAKTAAGVASRSSILYASTGRPCCTFFTSPTKVKADKQQEANNSSSEESRCSLPYNPPASPLGATSQARPSTSVEKTITQDQHAEVSSAEKKASSPAAACTGAAVVVRVTCKCGAHKEFSFDHSH